MNLHQTFDEEAHFELAFSPNILLVSPVRRFVSEFYATALNDPETASRVGMATHELLENAVKYARSGVSRLRVELRREGPLAAEIVIRTHNQADPADFDAVMNVLSIIDRAKDPFEAYQVLMGISAKRKHGSGLGLGRIRAEADMTLSCELNQGTLTVFARALLDNVRGP
ncbi:MAG: hypothetical protein NVSMB1_17690 [Polyangiales bacterium]